MQLISAHTDIYIYIYIYIYEVFKDHHVMSVGNRVNLHLCLTILTILRKSLFYQNTIIVLSLSCHSSERWPHGGSCVAVLRSSTPEIYSLLVHLYIHICIYIYIYIYNVESVGSLLLLVADTIWLVPIRLRSMGQGQVVRTLSLDTEVGNGVASDCGARGSLLASYT